MKQLKSTIQDLGEVFNRSISVKYLAEPFVAFDEKRPASEVRDFMSKRDFDIVGVRRDGVVVGYVKRDELLDEPVGAYVKPLDEQFVLEDWRPMLDAMQLLEKSAYVLVVVMGDIFGIITKGDLQKAPIRMWLFGMLSILEMQFLRLIRAAYPQDSWTGLITKKRLDDARECLKDRKKRNEAIDLADCLQFADKRDIILKTDYLRDALGFISKPKGKKLLNDLKDLRDDLAHSQDIIAGRWPKLIDLARKAEDLLNNCEDWKPNSLSN